MFNKEPFALLRILAIDPGLNNTGISIFDVAVSPFKILKIHSFTLKADYLIDRSGLSDESFSERMHKRFSAREAIVGITKSYRPSVVVSESPFFDRKRPSSFATLVEVITTYFDAIVAVDPLITFSIVEPLLVKKVLGVAGQKGKEVVIEAVSKLEVLREALDVPFKNLDDHAVDSIAVGYAWLTEKSGLIEKEKK